MMLSRESVSSSQTVAVLLLACGENRLCNLTAGLQRLRDLMIFDQISSVYEIEVEAQPPALVLACQGTTLFQALPLLRRVRALEVALSADVPGGLRKCLSCLVVFSGATVDTEGMLAIPHPALYAPLAEIIPGWREQSSGYLYATLAHEGAAAARVVKRAADLHVQLQTTKETGLSGRTV